MAKEAWAQCVFDVGPKEGELRCCKGLDGLSVPELGAPPNLFDACGPSIRLASLAKLESSFGRQCDWDGLMERIAFVDVVLLVEDRPVSENPILKDYLRASREGAAVLLERAGKVVLLLAGL